MLRSITVAAGCAAALVLAAPGAHASATKYKFEDATFPDGQTGTIHASTKTMDNKPDFVYCGYMSSSFQSLGYYDEFVEPAPSTAEAVEQFCLSHYNDRET